MGVFEGLYRRRISYMERQVNPDYEALMKQS